MKRKDKYKNTKYFTYENVNPKGRIAADCVIRAITKASGLDYNDVALKLFTISLHTGYMLNEKKCYEQLLKDLGFVKLPEPRKEDKTRYTVKEYMSQLSDTVIAYVGSHHVVPIIKHKVYDIWDSSNQILHSYWVKP